MIENSLATNHNASRGWDIEAVAPRCSRAGCPAHRARWTGFLRRFDGARLEGQWYCSSDCLCSAIESRIAHLAGAHPEDQSRTRHRIPLGLLLLSRGVIDHEKLQRALALQRASGERIGDCLRTLGFADENQITAALAAQNTCPVYPGDRLAYNEELLPLLLQRHYRMLPVHWVQFSRLLYVAFAESVNRTALFALETMLGCHTEPCIVRESELLRLLEKESRSSESEIAIDTPTTPLEVARTVIGYSQKTNSDSIRIIGCDAHLWVRLQGVHGNFDLLFRR